MVRPCLFSILALAALAASADVPAASIGPSLTPASQTHPLLGQVLDRQGRAVATTNFRTALAAADFVLVGEKHDSPEHHRLEARLIAERLEDRPGSAVVFEMLDDTQQAALARLVAGDSAATIRTKLAWPEKGWPFDAYGPLFEASLRGGRLIAGNLGRPFINQIYADGEAALGGAPRFATVATATAAVRASLLERIFEAHCEMQSRETLGPMVNIQLAKDASMADAMTQQGVALLIAGGEHVRGDTGVPVHLSANKSAPHAVVVQLLEVMDGETSLPAYVERTGPADFYVFTAATEARNYCADVKGRAAQ